jgi:hypothetical protein
MVYELASIGCTIQEIAQVTKVSIDTIKRRFHADYEYGMASMRQSLRRKQYQKAMEGNVGMLVWLGKNYLGQADKVEQTIKDEEAVIDRDAQARETRERLIREFSEEKLKVISKPH